MGEARRRGTFEERQLEGIIKRKAIEEERIKQRKLWQIAHKPSRSTMALASAIALVSGNNLN